MRVLADEIRSGLLAKMGMSFDEAVVRRSEYPEAFDPDDLSPYNGHALPAEVQEQLRIWQVLGTFHKLEIWLAKDEPKDSMLIGKLDERIYLLAHWNESTRYVLTIGGLCFEYETLARRGMKSSPYFAISAVFLLVAGLGILLLTDRSLLSTTLGTALFIFSLITARLWRECKFSDDHYQQIIDANAELRKTLQDAG